jgi:hypothetical protein
MNEDALDQLSGQISAISSTLASLMTTLPPAMAAEAATHLEANRCVLLEEDDIQETPASQSATRDLLLTGYVDLLRAVASHG